MDKDKLKKYYEEFKVGEKALIKTRGLTPVRNSNSTQYLSKPEKNSIDKILDQRYNHRSIVVFLVLLLTLIPLALIVILISIQIFYRIHNPSFRILDGHELEVLAVSIFGESVGILAIITKSLWDDRPYKEFFKKNNTKG